MNHFVLISDDMNVFLVICLQVKSLYDKEYPLFILTRYYQISLSKVAIQTIGLPIYDYSKSNYISKIFNAVKCFGFRT